MALNVENTKKAMAIPAIFRLAFRPLFLLGTLFSVIAVAWWVHYWLNPFQWTPYGGAIWWHGHEMLFGFAIAIVTGFLLTAVKTWTGVPGLSGSRLALFVLLWITGRFLIAFGAGLSSWLIAIIDVSYLVFAAIAMAYPVIKVKQWRNLMFIPILLILAILNATSHWAAVTNQPIIAMKTLHATIMLIVLIVAVLGGRVIPAFTANGTGKSKLSAIKLLEITSIVSILVMIVIALLGFDSVNPALLLIISLIATIANGIRFSRWGIQHTWSTPLLWSLHLSFIFIPIGFLLLTLHAISLISDSTIMSNTSAALHSFTIGGIGGMILAMISRVTLGHTGRPLKPNPIMTIGFALILIATLIRVVLPTWFPTLYSISISLTGIGWIGAFLLFLFFYARILVTTRADGRPG